MNLPITLLRKLTAERRGILLKNNLLSGSSDLLVYNVYFHRVLRTLFWTYIEERYEPFSNLWYRSALCHSIISKVLATCPPAVHLSFNGSKSDSGKIVVKDESGNNNVATMEDGNQVILSGGKCGDCAVSSNGMGFKCYAKGMNILKVLKRAFSCVNLTPLI